jgi:hypothetical protein
VQSTPHVLARARCGNYLAKNYGALPIALAVKTDI